MKANKLSGSCLCGEVSYQFTEDIKVFQYCHGSRCQKFTGSAHAANISVDPGCFQWTSGGNAVGRYELAEAKHFATSFCKKCGSSLPWLTQSKKAMVIPAGTLDDTPSMKPMHNIYYSDKAEWYEDVCNLVKYDELPVK
ncbi:MAG: GFA family protein [Proteobacteria bacterium]|nr:GFA family protein [Pseudomonadota bacterium]